MNTKQELFSSTPRPVNPAHIAIRAAKHRQQWGRLAARQYISKRGVSMRLYRIAVQCEAAQRAGL